MHVQGQPGANHQKPHEGPGSVVDPTDGRGARGAPARTFAVAELDVTELESTGRADAIGASGGMAISGFVPWS